ncbi:phosphotransferase [Streptomyces jietaisiensis]|uniref:phosphotransferase family protein n=1 Tax=Streptomyces griseoaurantiacus TaxID=68213 RepID=UPI00324B0DE4
MAKLLTTSEPLWADKFSTEIDAYQTFAATPPPVSVPALVAADDRDHVLLIEHIRGRSPVPGRDRFPPRALSPAHVTAILTALTHLGRWRPPAGAFTRTPDYLARLGRDHHHGLTTPQEHRILTDLFHQAGTVLVPGHGDPLVTNFVVRPDGQVVVIDWEHAGHYLPGHDLAVVWITLAATPKARFQIEELVAAEPPRVRAAFAMNRAMLLVRELRNHRALPPSPWRDERVAAIGRDWQAVRELLLTG